MTRSLLDPDELPLAEEHAVKPIIVAAARALMAARLDQPLSNRLSFMTSTSLATTRNATRCDCQCPTWLFRVSGRLSSVGWLGGLAVPVASCDNRLRIN